MRAFFMSMDLGEPYYNSPYKAGREQVPTFRERPDLINKKGRPKKGECLTEILRADSHDFVGESTITRKEAISRKLWALALDGDMAALKYVYDRIDGAPKQSAKLEHVGEDGGPLAYEVKWVE